MRRGSSDDSTKVPPGRRSQRAAAGEITQAQKDAGYERSDAPASGIVKAGLALAAMILVALPLVALALAGVLRSWGPAASTPPMPAAEPSIHADQRTQRLTLESEARDRLSRPAWVDKERRIARIPVDEAMRLLADHGWPEEDRPDDRLPSGAGRAVPR